MKQNTNITNERVRILYGRAFSSITTAVATAFIMAYIFREQIASPVLLGWLGFVSVVAVVRYGMVLDYNKNKQYSSGHKKYESRYSYFAGLAGLSWAFFIITALNLAAFEYRIYSLLLLTAIVALAVPIFSSSIKTIYLYITPSLITVIPLLLSRGGNDTALGLALIIFSAMVIRASRNGYNALNDVLTLRYKAQELAESLKQLHHEKSETEKHIQAIMDYAPTSIYVKDLEGRYTFINQKAIDTHHIKQDELVGKTLHDVFPKDIADVLEKNDRDVIQAKRPLEFEEDFPSDDGLHHYISIRFPLFDKTGKLYAVGGVSTDITERFRAEESLRMSQQRVLLHREQSPVGIIEWSTDFEVVDWNPAAERIFGYTKDEVIGKNILDRIVPEAARPAVDEVWQELLANKGGTYSINENITKEGRTILCEWHNTPLINVDGNVIGVSAIVDDITERQKQEDNARQTQKMDAIGKLTGGIAHDFNNMLGVILGFSELLKHSLDKDNTKQIKYCDEVINAGERAKKLTSNLLEFSRIAPSSAETTYINELLSGMQHMLEKTLTPRIKLVFELEEGLWPVWLDKARFEDAILNMSINAMHAMPDGGKLTLNTSTRHFAQSDAAKLDIPVGDYVVLSITDTGNGMDPEVQQKIFDPFFTTKGTEGTGLGLSQVHGFVQQAGGNIKVSSEIGQGTTLTLYFPRHDKHENDQIELPATDFIEIASSQDTILVVDDEAALLDLNEVLLTTSGYKVLLAKNAEQALEILKNNSVDLMLCDAIMPEVDGYQLAAEVTKLYPDLKIQMISGYSNGHNKNVANGKLHKERLRKPVAADALRRRVMEILDETK